MPDIDISTPRECIYKAFEDDPGPCPRCGSELHQSSQTYMVATREGGREGDSFMIGGDFGWFCPSCSTVVIDPHKVHDMLGYGKPDWNVGPEFAVLGVVDLEAIPPEKEHLPLGEDDNPIPLVPFTGVTNEGDFSIPKQLTSPPNRITASKSGPPPSGIYTSKGPKKRRKKKRRRK